MVIAKHNKCAALGIFIDPPFLALSPEDLDSGFTISKMVDSDNGSGFQILGRWTVPDIDGMLSAYDEVYVYSIDRPGFILQRCPNGKRGRHADRRRLRFGRAYLALNDSFQAVRPKWPTVYWICCKRAPGFW